MKLRRYMRHRDDMLSPGLVWLLALLWLPAGAEAQAVGSEARPGDMLVVTAHPDDEAMFAATIYRLTHALEWDVDLALVTDGSGGFRYAALAEPLYGLELTEEPQARHHLPAVRKRELMAAGEILGIRNYYFLEQYDHAYTENVDTVLAHVWDADAARNELRNLMQRGSYDFVFVHLPVPEFHAHHKAATILALEAARGLDAEQRPVVLGSFVGNAEGPDPFGASEFTQHEGYPITRVRRDVGPFVFDRHRPIDETGRLDYRIVVNWVIAEHKSQGTMQLLINQGDVERFWLFEANAPSALDRARRLFERLR